MTRQAKHFRGNGDVTRCFFQRNTQRHTRHIPSAATTPWPRLYLYQANHSHSYFKYHSAMLSSFIKKITGGSADAPAPAAGAAPAASSSSSSSSNDGGGLFSFGAKVAYKKQEEKTRVNAEYDYLFKFLVIGDSKVCNIYFSYAPFLRHTHAPNECTNICRWGSHASSCGSRTTPTLPSRSSRRSGWTLRFGRWTAAARW